MPIVGPRGLYAELIAPGDVPINVTKRMTINGGLWGPLAYPAPAITTTGTPTFITAPVTFTNVSNSQDGSGNATLTFVANSVPSTTATNGACCSFLVPVPMRTGNFTKMSDVQALGGPSYDANGYVISAVTYYAVVGGTNMMVNYFPNDAVSNHAINITIKYALSA